MIRSAHFHGRDVVHRDKLFYGDARELAADARLRLLPPGLSFSLLGLKLGLPCATFLQFQREDRHRTRPFHQALLNARLLRLPFLLRRLLLLLTRDSLAGVRQPARVLLLFSEIGLPLAMIVRFPLLMMMLLLMILLLLRLLALLFLFGRKAEFLVPMSYRPRWCRSLSRKLIY